MPKIIASVLQLLRERRLGDIDMNSTREDVRHILGPPLYWQGGPPDPWPLELSNIWIYEELYVYFTDHSRVGQFLIRPELILNDHNKWALEVSTPFEFDEIPGGDWMSENGFINVLDSIGIRYSRNRYKIEFANGDARFHRYDRLPEGGDGFAFDPSQERLSVLRIIGDDPIADLPPRSSLPSPKM
jgi:hypothetical protein